MLDAIASATAEAPRPLEDRAPGFGAYFRRASDDHDGSCSCTAAERDR